MGFRDLTIQKEVFYDNMNRYYSLLSSTNTATDEDIILMKDWATRAEIDAHTIWSQTFLTKFCN